MDSSYPRAVLTAALQGLLTGAWVAAGELPAGKRRLVRAGSVLSLSAVAAIGEPDDADAPEPSAEQYANWDVDKRKLAVTAVSLGVAVGFAVGRRRLEKRWLAALVRDGHPYPHRALALRMGLLSFAGTLPGRLVKVHEGRATGGSGAVRR
jgi:hypothetical protein